MTADEVWELLRKIMNMRDELLDSTRVRQWTDITLSDIEKFEDALSAYECDLRYGTIEDQEGVILC